MKEPLDSKRQRGWEETNSKILRKVYKKQNSKSEFEQGMRGAMMPIQNITLILHQKLNHNRINK